jgi:hypothetical protein
VEVAEEAVEILMPNQVVLVVADSQVVAAQ